MHPTLPLTTDELLTTTRTVRKRLDLSRPVGRDVVEECLRLAVQAPTGRDQQAWSWVLVDDPDLRRQVADLYRGGLHDHLERASPGATKAPMDSPRSPQIASSVSHLVDVLGDVPVLLVPSITPEYGLDSSFGRASAYGSLLPAVWSLMLALRSRGLGSAWTTLHLHREREMAELLGIPYPDELQVGLFPIAYTRGTEFRSVDRSRSEERILWNGWAPPRPS